jgi:DNA helicase-2/ATP-dependent DNA helicase PcrA
VRKSEMSTLNELQLRPSQQEILAYRGGRMGVSAVPGSGKTWTLSLLAADLIIRGGLKDDQEVLVVTLVNSAVDNFYQRVSDFIKQRDLLPFMGYRVRTLHGLAHDIVRGRPDLVGLEDRFQIVDEREAENIRSEAAQSWLRAHPYGLDDFLDQDLDENRRDWLRRDKLPELVSGIALEFIRYAKDLRLTPERLREQLDQLPVPLGLAEMGLEIYEDYQQALRYRSAVDFDDLIRLALQALENDAEYLNRLRVKWPYILEDEAQDSSRLQELILGLLVGEHGNWVRVGDPNQAIYETFTTADPRYLRAFVRSQDVVERALPNSGRSTQSIIDLANYLVTWTMDAHPVEDVRDALSAPPLIEPTPAGDPQPNPEDDPEKIILVAEQFSPQDELEAVADSLARWLPNNPDATVAVLTPRNVRGFEMVDALRRRGLEYVDSLLRSSSLTRFSAGALANLLQYLSDPTSARKLAIVYKVWRRGDREDEAASTHIEQVAKILRGIPHLEDYLWPGLKGDWLQQSDLDVEDPLTYQSLGSFREQVRRWQASVQLPIDQIVLALAQDLLSEPAELAVAHKLSVLLRQVEIQHPDWRLPQMTEELAAIARNQRRFLGFGDEEQGFDPDHYRGKVVVATVHKAKGLEWDRVYLMSVNNYDFPSAREYDQYIAEKWYLRDQLNLNAEALAQLDALLSYDQYSWYQQGQATQRARLDYVRERLRLFYVGITRARKELVVTWNTGRRGDMLPAEPFQALQAYWQNRWSKEELP